MNFGGHNSYKPAFRLVPVAAVLGLALTAAAVAFASPTSHVVQKGGTIAGEPYSYYMKVVWTQYFSSKTAPARCDTIKVNGVTVGVVTDFGGGNSTCSEPAGRPIYINEVSDECSSLPGQHPLGDSNVEIAECSWNTEQYARVVASINKQNVYHFGRNSWVGTGGNGKAFPVKVPAGRFKGVRAQTVRTYGWGWSMLLKGFSKGKYTVRCTGQHPNYKFFFRSTVTLNVH
jgi:hypothetical protein